VLGNIGVVARSQHLLGRVADAAGDTDSARAYWETALETFEAVDAPHDALETLERLFESASERGDDRQADLWVERAERVLTEAPEPTVEYHGQWIDDRRIEREAE